MLVDGQSTSLSGTLATKHLGYALYVTIKTPGPVVLKWPPSDLDAIRESEKFDKTDRSTVNEIWVILPGQEDVLLNRIGQTVRVRGKVQLNATSPYYFNGTLITADTVEFADGSILLPQVEPYVQGPPPGTEKYYGSVTLTMQGRWAYRAWDGDGHELIPAKGLLSCRLNGSGDVVNCFCADHFKPTGSGVMNNGRYMLEEKTDWDFAQFSVPDTEGRIVTFSKAIECVRAPPQKLQ
jgi:hypothetical protein